MKTAAPQPESLTGSVPEEPVDQVIALYREAVAAGQAPDREAILAAHPQLQAELESFFAAEERFRLAAKECLVVEPPGKDVDEQESAAAASATPPSVTGATALAQPGARVGPHFGDYELVREIARGGMGIVYEARQRSLNRVVALKTIRSGELAEPADLRRFRSEAEAAACLDHPNIVPIYEVGEHDGRAYFSMKFIEGGALTRAVLCLLAAPRTAARLLATVARAVHYAHQRGILHRDLKPANILIDDAGQPYITDFGLAKRVLNPEEPPAAGGLTEPGMIVGTPSYMAPEQATGKPEKVTTAVDVYALGAILYELLAGCPPFRGSSRLETLRQVEGSEPERPRCLNPQADRDLETICLKCLDKEPRRRYLSAQALAEDLERYLNGEPIEARPAGAGERLWRWCRRKPVVAGLAAGLAACIVVGLALVSWQWRRAEHNLLLAQNHFLAAEEQRRQAEENLHEAERQKVLYERSFHQAHQAVEDFSTQVSQSWLINVPGLEPLRKELLEGALKYYQDFLDQRKDDPGLRAELAAAHFRVAMATSAIGSPPRAVGSYEKARDLYRQLLQTAPEDARIQGELARTYNNMGILLSTTGKPAAALASFQQARDLFTQLLAAHPGDAQLQTDLAGSYINIAIGHQEAGRIDDARVSFERACALREQAVKAQPTNITFRAELASSYDNLGSLFHRIDHPKEALAHFQKALQLREQLIAKHASSTPLRADLASSYDRIGNWHRVSGKPADALDFYRKGQAIWQRLAQESPQVTYYQTSLAENYNNTGVTHSLLGQPKESLAAYERSQGLWEKLAHEQPAVGYFRRALARGYLNIGARLGLGGKPAQAAELFERARPILEEMVRSDPDNLDLQNELGRLFNNLALTLAQLGRHDQAVAACRRAIDHQRVALTRAPQTLFYRQALSDHYGSLAQIERQAGHPIEAAQASRQRQQLWPSHPAELVGVARELALAAELVGRGKTQQTADEKQQRDQIVQDALAALRQALRTGYKDVGQLKKDPAFSMLRSRPEFQQLIQ
jgi:tetratricopeptide (TPR) repeat protein/tRNA A-37 threonylcarbamoyl transferase component Bud32